MIRIELTAKQQAALQAALQQVADGQQIILTADGVELAAMIPMNDLEPQPDETAPQETPATLADFLQGHVGVLNSSEYVPGGARLSQDCGGKLAQGLAAQHQLKKL